MRRTLVLLSLLLCAMAPAAAQVSVSIHTANVSIGINVPRYPHLVRVPSYPVYYASDLDENYFFYDGAYWVYEDDSWYASSWYDGPWQLVEPQFVPLFILRVPVRYYRRAPAYFRGWRSDAPPRWDEHWGHEWAQHRRGWDHWDPRSVPAPAPLPSYQRQYSGDRYPHQTEQQHALRRQHYNYQPHDSLVRRQYEAQPQRNAPPSRNEPRAPHAQPSQQTAPPTQPREHATPNSQRDDRRSQPQEYGGQQSQHSGREQTPNPKQGKGRDKENDKADPHDHDRG